MSQFAPLSFGLERRKDVRKIPNIRSALCLAAVAAVSGLAADSAGATAQIKPSCQALPSKRGQFNEGCTLVRPKTLTITVSYKHIYGLAMEAVCGKRRIFKGLAALSKKPLPASQVKFVVNTTINTDVDRLLLSAASCKLYFTSSAPLTGHPMLKMAISYTRRAATKTA